MTLSPFLKYGLIFSAIPMISTYVIGHLFKLLFLPDLISMTDINDPDRMSVPIIEFVFPFAVLSGLIAFAVWFLFMRKSPNIKKAAIAGVVTVFVSYPILGFAIGFIYPDLTDRLTSAVIAAFSLAFFGNVTTFWLTYPLGAICGGLIGTRYVNSFQPKFMHEFD